YVAAYEAAPGEVNDLTVQDVAGSIVLNDPGAEITPGEGCAATTTHSATCTSEFGLSSAYADLGDEADHFISEGPPFSVEGGAGDDVLEGGTAGGTFDGDEGDDILRGGAHVSGFSGGDGADQMIGTEESDRFMGGPGPDSIDGRGEFQADWSEGDVVSYEDHDAPVTVDLSKPGSPAGAAGEGDVLTNVESVYGGQGPDKLTARKELFSTGFGSGLGGAGGDDLIRGGPGRDTLAGGGGDDSVRGGGDDDLLKGGPGRDTLIGGGGSNELWSFDARRPERDSVRCGEGGSVYAGSAAAPVLDAVDQSCGYVDLWGPIVDRVVYGYVGRPTRAVKSTVECLRHCGLTIRLRAHGKLLGSATREIRGIGSATLAIPLTRAARDELKRAGMLKLGFAMDISWGARLRHPQATSWHLLLHDPPAAR
ncbi:MAG: hypothetical protein QOH83_600, partial [Solirubrobacteraceae bacterium]|nr:hypothetical protein [Solirubrobacteraceae bacterium]